MKRELTLAISAALLAASGTALAVTDIEGNATIPFNLANPGARSMGMGGAFVGLADDATAAYTNPAGLTQLVTPEISIEGRHTEYSVPRVIGGNATLNPFDGSGITTAEADSSRTGLSFLSVVYPHDRWSFAAYRDELVNFNSNFAPQSFTVGVLLGNQYETFPETHKVDLKIIDYGFSVAYKAGDSISLGAGLSYYNFDISTFQTRFAFENAFQGVPAGTAINQQVQDGSDNDIGVNLGARFVLNEHWSAGVTYRGGPRFGYEATNTVLLTDSGAPFVAVDLKNVRFKVPDQFGVGLSWHPTDALIVNLDADYIQYSQLTHGMGSLFGSDATTVSHLSIPNGAEVHLGGEYTFTQMAHPFSLRAGVWHDPRHSIEYKGDPGTDLGPIALAALFHGGKGSQTHYAFGGGFAFAKFQIDAAADFSDQTDTFSLSGVYHF